MPIRFPNSTTIHHHGKTHDTKINIHNNNNYLNKIPSNGKCHAGGDISLSAFLHKNM